MTSNGPGVLVFVIGFLACFGLVFVAAFLNMVRLVLAAKSGGLEAAPKFCPHCGEPTLLGGGIWYPTSPRAALRGASMRVGPFRIGGPLTKVGWTCVKCGGTAS